MISMVNGADERARRAPATASRWGRVRTAWHDAFRPPEMEGEANRRLMELARRTRLAIGVLALPATLFLPIAHEYGRAVLFLLVGLVYLPYALVISRVSLRLEHVAVRLLNVVGDLGIVFMFSALVPDTRIVALLGYLLSVAFHTFLGGLAVGIGISAVAVALAGLAEWTADGALVDGYTLAMFAVVAVTLSVIVETATKERRRTARFFARLQRAIASVPASPDLDDTLHSVAWAGRDASGAKFVSVLVRDGAGVTQGALEGDHDPDPPERSADMIAEILRDPLTSPSGIVLTTGERVVVPVIADDPRFARWIPETRRQGFTSTVAVPLRAGETVIGVLAAYFPSPSLVDAETVELLGAYAEHASLVVLRAVAYEHERRAAARLAEADALKSEVVATVSHELRTPLTAVKGFVETLLRHWERFDDDERRDLLRRTLRNADLLGTLVDQVLDYSRLEAGAVVTVNVPLDLGEAARRIIEERALLLLAGHVVDLDVPTGVTVEADAAGLERVLENLLSNAAKYSPPGTRITVRVAAEGLEGVLSVSDEGAGIAEDEFDRIFDRFYRVERGYGPRGTGIGLAVVKRYTELMGGRMKVESELGRGSTFSLFLPLTVPFRAGEVSGQPVSASPSRPTGSR